ncbi:unnamed protein product [Lepeophtheirus salmonis]|uniref:(salmon louse) hypothetical protein n=1 Tax=Lepeophtheirus salmonis TaxID=72036 RepID=A0A7R8D3F3_LEPSM|nr:unnamed protein product [Lepeophtheirus salmonis]CAF2984241.1 unnamed protein product [Lepeophtheirus salmonis]
MVLTSSVDRVPASSIIRKSKMSRVQGNSYSMTLSELKKNKDYGTKFVKELGEIPEQDEDTNKVSSKVKRVKVKIDKTNPNWRLKPLDHVTVYDSDPFFESTSMDFPFISTTHHISSLTIRRSLANDMVPMMYAIMAEDRDAIKILVSEEASNKSRAPSPIQMIETTSTGIYNYRSLGIKNIRQIEASRGGREGNNALTKDDTKSKSDLNTFVLSKKLSVDFFEFLIEEKVVSVSTYSKRWKRGTKGMRETSVIKKGNESITPLHLACLNPNVNVLKSLLSVSSNLWIEDSHKRSLIHYAAACTKGLDALKYLFSKSVSLEVPDKEGYTPLIIASNIENVKAMEFIILNLSKDNEFDSKVGIGGVDRALKNSWCPIHLAAVDNKFKSLKVLLKHKARVDKPLNTKYGKLTALMLASGMGNLEMVKFLVEHGQAKVEALDKFKRSALTHAVMNGAANVASYLLKLGADSDRKDSSGNSNLHYACAYGWYHCAVLLLETGAVPDPNIWTQKSETLRISMKHPRGTYFEFLTFCWKKKKLFPTKELRLNIQVFGCNENGYAKNLIDMEKFRLNNSNLLFDICRIYANFPIINHKDFEGYSICAYNCLWELARDILSNFLKKFEPNLRKSVEKNKQIGEISAHSILLNANNEPLVNPENSYFKPAFEILCEYDKDFEAIDCDGITCLIRSIRSNNMVEFKNYIAKGANIFAVHEELNPMVYEEDRKDAQGLCCRDPLVETIISGNMEMFNTLLKAGAVLPITKLPIYPIFIVAVDKVINDRNNTDRMGILEQILALCKLQNDTTVDGFNALHLSINNSTDDFNINLEIESLLFKCGVNPVLQDSFGRIPLHYAFIKNYFKKSVRSEYKFIPGKGNNLSTIDPIEVVSMTIDGMQGKLVDTVDENGSSPLHYASYRGSTVCCMLLVDHNADINRMDRFGNTPLAYAIIGKHEATTITLLQKGANVNCKVHINPFLMGFSETQIVEKDVNQSNAFKFLPSHFKKPAKSQFPMTLFQLSLLNGWLGVSYLILERMEKHGLRIAEALEVAFKLNKLQLAKKLTLKQLDNSKLCELVDNKRNLISSMIKVVGNSSKDNLLIEFIFNHLYKAGNKLQHKDIFGCTVLHYGCLTNNIDILKLILSYFESKHIINEKDNNGRTPLVATLWKCPLESSLVLVKELLSRGADPNGCCNFKKFDYLHNDSHPSTVNLTYEDIRNAELTELTTPLIIAINFKCRSLIDLLLEHGVDVNLRDGKGRTPLMIAVKSNDLDFIKYFLNASISHIGSNLNNTPPLSKKRKFQKIMKLDIQAKDVEGYNVGHHALFRNSLFDASHDNVESNFPYNIVKDAQAMFDILSNKSCDENKKGDELDDNKNPRSVTGLTLKSGFLFQGYTALLSKICGDHGEWGIYNFYRMQIWKDQLKELYVSLHKLGKMGRCCKTGNDWSNRHEFVPKLNKYRQLDIKSFIKKSRPKIMFDLMTDLPSKLPEEVQTSIKHISNVAMYKNAYYNLGIDDHVIPFGQISRTNIQKAKTLLEEIQTLILEKKGLKDINDEPNVSNTKIVPILTEFVLESEIRITSYLLEFEFAERVLLGAQYRKKEINPLDYIYNALSVELTPMKADDYMMDAIFKVSRKGNNSMSVDEFLGAPPKLLWHGTKCINLLSILNVGLVINPPYAERSGDTFGKGIYTADVYDKSFGYCDQNSRYSYMFLCKAALGKTFERDNWRKNNENSKDVFNSTSILGLYEPLSRDELYLRNGVRIPTGKITEHVTNKYRCFNYNEFIIKEESRLSTDYLVN